VAIRFRQLDAGGRTSVRRYEQRHGNGQKPATMLRTAGVGINLDF
jgi:hypothetical protein